MRNSRSPRIFAVIVTYKPDGELLARLILALAPQVWGGVVVNNGTDLLIPSDFFQRHKFAVVHLQSNMGVASALNVGFQRAQADSAEFVITFDQDSEPVADMVSQLLAAYQALVSAGRHVGAVGPQQIDRRSGKRAVFLAPIAWSRHRIVLSPGQTAEVDHLLTSGCLIPVQTWKHVGDFLEELFIDYVDIEWSLRLRHHGYCLFGVSDAKLMHSIGDDVVHWRNREFAWHSALRHYFMFRNGVYLQKLPHISLSWKLFDAVQLAKKLVIFTLVGRPRRAHLAAMLRGIMDGWRGRLGAPRLAVEAAKRAQNSVESESN